MEETQTPIAPAPEATPPAVHPAPSPVVDRPEQLGDFLARLSRAGGTLHPANLQAGPGVAVGFPGCTVLDFFAAAALQGILAPDPERAILWEPDTTAGLAYHFAAAMQAERDRRFLLPVSAPEPLAEGA